MATKKETLEAALRGEGCLGKAADDEPVFVLRAHDAFSADAIDYWAKLLKGQTTNWRTDVMHNPDKYNGAIEVISAIKRWQTSNGLKVPD